MPAAEVWQAVGEQVLRRYGWLSMPTEKVAVSADWINKMVTRAALNWDAPATGEVLEAFRRRQIRATTPLLADGMNLVGTVRAHYNKRMAADRIAQVMRSPHDVFQMQIDLANALRDRRELQRQAGLSAGKVLIGGGLVGSGALLGALATRHMAPAPSDHKQLKTAADEWWAPHSPAQRGSRIWQAVQEQVLARYGLEKQALVGSAAAMGAGLGLGLGAAAGYYRDDPTKSVNQHLLAGLRGAAVGGLLGGVGGAAVGKAVSHLDPELAAFTRWGPFPLSESLPYILGGNGGKQFTRQDLYQAAGQHLWKAWTHPVTRVALGAAVGSRLGQAVQSFYDRHNLVRNAAQHAQAEAPEEPNAAWLGAAMAREHMGPYSSSLDWTRPVKTAADEWWAPHSPAQRGSRILQRTLLGGAAGALIGGVGAYLLGDPKTREKDVRDWALAGGFIGGGFTGLQRWDADREAYVRAKRVYETAARTFQQPDAPENRSLIQFAMEQVRKADARGYQPSTTISWGVAPGDALDRAQAVRAIREEAMGHLQELRRTHQDTAGALDSIDASVEKARGLVATLQAQSKQAQYDVLRQYGLLSESAKTAGALPHILRGALRGGIGLALDGAVFGGLAGYVSGGEDRVDRAKRWALRGAQIGGGLGVLGGGAGGFLGHRRESAALMGSPAVSPHDAQVFQDSFETLRRTDHAAERAARQARLETELSGGGSVGPQPSATPSASPGATPAPPWAPRDEDGWWWSTAEDAHEALLDKNRVWEF